MNPRRRRLLAAGAAALLVSGHAGAQKPARIGWLVGSNAAENALYRKSFAGRMRELGRVEDRDYVVEVRYAEGDYKRLPGLAAELVRLKVDLILTVATTVTMAARKATESIPIVMVTAGDPVGMGLIKSLARPGGNVTGNVNNLADLAPKQLELLLETVPKLSRVAVLMKDTLAHRETLKSVQALAPAKGVALVPILAENPREIEAAFGRMATEKVQALFIATDPVYAQYRRLIVGLTMKERLPSISLTREWPDAGLLMSYGPSPTYLAANAAVYVDKILKGAKPAELPVEQATAFDLVINLKTAKALGVTIPSSLRMRADDKIQ